MNKFTLPAIAAAVAAAVFFAASAAQATPWLSKGYDFCCGCGCGGL
ncbi:MAG: hypothetical protein ACYYKD_01395 [Rhodospirillales bacterium]